MTYFAESPYSDFLAWDAFRSLAFYDYRDVKNANGDVVYRIKECVDDFEYQFHDPETGQGSR